MAQVLRLTCGKCGKSCVLVAQNRITQKVGDAMKVTCEQAGTVFESMGGCEESPLKLTAIKMERGLQPKDITLEGFPKSFAKAALAARKQTEEATKPPEPKKTEAGAENSESDPGEPPDQKDGEEAEADEKKD